VGGDLVDSLNFIKQDANFAPPKTKSGTIAQAMLAKVRVLVYIFSMIFLTRQWISLVGMATEYGIPVG